MGLGGNSYGGLVSGPRPSLRFCSKACLPSKHVVTGSGVNCRKMPYIGKDSPMKGVMLCAPRDGGLHHLAFSRSTG